MIPRYQRILLWSISALILLVAAFTIRERQKSHDRIVASNDAMPYIEPVNAQTESVTLALANDAAGSVDSVQRDAALPHEPSLRARALLDRLFVEYSLPGSTHVLKPGTAVDDVFLLKTPIGPPTATSPYQTGMLAVVNLHGAFAEAHPSGIEVESLTVQSIVGTLHANLPEITQVRFLVDGQQRETLAGHADLLRTYSASETIPPPTQPVEMK